MINAQFNNKQSRTFASVDLIRILNYKVEKFETLRYDSDIFVVTMVTILKQKHI